MECSQMPWCKYIVWLQVFTLYDNYHVFVTLLTFIMITCLFIISKTIIFHFSKHVMCFYGVIKTQVEAWEKKKCCRKACVHISTAFLTRNLPNVHKCFYNSIETQITCLLFLLENSVTKRRQLVFFDDQNVNSLCSWGSFFYRLCLFCVSSKFSIHINPLAFYQECCSLIDYNKIIRSRFLCVICALVNYRAMVIFSS